MSACETKLSSEVPFANAADERLFVYLGKNAQFDVVSPDRQQSAELGERLRDVFEHCGREAVLHVAKASVKAAQEQSLPLSCVMKFS